MLVHLTDKFLQMHLFRIVTAFRYYTSSVLSLQVALARLYVSDSKHQMAEELV